VESGLHPLVRYGFFIAMIKGWIKTHRKILEWGWYSDLKVRATFQHLMLIANYERKEWMGHTIEPGQVYTSYASLANQVGITEKEIRTALSKLQKTKEIVKKRAGNGQIITLTSWEFHQSSEQDGADLGQTLGRLGATPKESKKERSKEYKNIGRKHSFQNSPFFDKNEFAKALSGDKFKDVDLRYWYERASEYSEGTGKTYKNWSIAVQGWIRRAREEGKKAGFKETKSVTDHIEWA